MTVTCPHCKREFRPPPGMRTLVSGEGHELVCPHCKERFRGEWMMYRLIKEATK